MKIVAAIVRGRRVSDCGLVPARYPVCIAAERNVRRFRRASSTATRRWANSFAILGEIEAVESEFARGSRTAVR